MKLLESTDKQINKKVENFLYLEIIEVVLVHCNIVNKDCQRDSIALYTFVPNKSFGQLLNISPTNVLFLKTFKSGFSYTEVLKYGLLIKTLNRWR